MKYLHPDLHMHSTSSDGTDTPVELIDKVRQAGVDIFSLTDHDTFLGCQEIMKYRKPTDPAFVGGIELSCRDSIGKYHILGYGYNIDKSSIIQAVEVVHKARMEKTLNRIAFLEQCGCHLTQEDRDELLANENPGKPHFVDLLLKKGVVKNKAEGFAMMSTYKGKERKLTPEEAIDAILGADGLPVLAHGLLEDGDGLLSNEEMEERVVRLKNEGLMGLECYYSLFTEEQTEFMVSLAEKYNLIITAGSDYHGTKKPVHLGDTGYLNPDKLERFYNAVRHLLV